MLEDVRAARLAGLRMVVCDRLFLRSGARRAANCGNAWFRGPRISGRDAQHFQACAASPPERTRRLTFLKAGRGHTTSASSSAIAAAISFDCDCDCDNERGLFGKVENCQDFER